MRAMMKLSPNLKMQDDFYIVPFHRGFGWDRLIFKFIKGDQSILEREPLEKIVDNKQMVAFKHTGFWMCMDTKRDKDKLEEIFKSKKLKW